MKTILVLTVTAMLAAVPADAFAGKPAQKPSHGGKGQPKVQYILKGSLSAYTAASSGGNGTITILVKRSNRHGRALDGQSLTLPVSTSTRIVLHNGTTTIADNDNGIVKIRAPKHVAATADLVTTLQAAMARQVIVQGAAKTTS